MLNCRRTNIKVTYSKGISWIKGWMQEHLNPKDIMLRIGIFIIIKIKNDSKYALLKDLYHILLNS